MKISTLISACMLVMCARPQALAFSPFTSRHASSLAARRTQLNLLLPLDSLNINCDALNSNSPVLSSSLDLSLGILSADSIKEAFNIATFFPQIFWLFLIITPQSFITKKLMGGYEIITIFCLVHFFIVSASVAQPDGTAPMAEFADVFDPSGDPQKAMVGMMKYPNFVSEEWSHVLTWDLFVGRYIWLDGLKRGIFTSHSVLLCNLIGPPGLLLHWATCLVTGKGLPGNDADEIDQLDN